MNTFFHIANTANYPLIANTAVLDALDCLTSTPSDKNEIAFSVLSGMTCVNPVEVIVTFDDLQTYCRKPEVRDNKDGSAFCPATFTPPYRKKENAQECSVLAFDFDALPDWVTGAVLLDCISEYRTFCYSTFSHTITKHGCLSGVAITLSMVGKVKRLST